eukprot:TRINITY_DN5719_c0_g1_i2.p4 TRINITY_DN5719_c0_g1~~TRINITY_DN5719_c0_g1_i2.p4  ORF type:complete len:130 (+),score=3.02 TRINITY_DN5719_c0_g1_i2:46-435(+)
MQMILLLPQLRMVRNFRLTFFLQQQFNNEFQNDLHWHYQSYFNQSFEGLIDLISQQEILGACENLKLKSASGIYEIKNLFISQTMHILPPYILPLFNLLLLRGMYPSLWKQCRVVAVPKPGQDIQLLGQ